MIRNPAPSSASTREEAVRAVVLAWDRRHRRDLAYAADPARNDRHRRTLPVTAAELADWPFRHAVALRAVATAAADIVG